MSYKFKLNAGHFKKIFPSKQALCKKFSGYNQYTKIMNGFYNTVGLVAVSISGYQNFFVAYEIIWYRVKCNIEFYSDQIFSLKFSPVCYDSKFLLCV